MISLVISRLKEAFKVLLRDLEVNKNSDEQMTKFVQMGIRHIYRRFFCHYCVYGGLVIPNK